MSQRGYKLYSAAIKSIMPPKAPASPNKSPNKQPTDPPNKPDEKNMPLDYIRVNKGHESISLPINPENNIYDPNYIYKKFIYDPKVYSDPFDPNIDEITPENYNAFCTRLSKVYEQEKTKNAPKEAKEKKEKDGPSAGYLQTAMKKHKHFNAPVYLPSLSQGANIRPVSSNIQIYVFI